MGKRDKEIEKERRKKYMIREREIKRAQKKGYIEREREIEGKRTKKVVEEANEDIFRPVLCPKQTLSPKQDTATRYMPDHRGGHAGRACANYCCFSARAVWEGQHNTIVYYQ